MQYSTVSTVALVVHIIINWDVLINKGSYDKIKLRKTYRRFLFSVMAFYVIDILWGVLFDLGFDNALFVNTTLFFLTMMVTIWIWTRLVVLYLGTNTIYGKLLSYIGTAFLILDIIVLAVNCFVPIMFWIDADGYHTGIARDIIYLAQMALFFFTAVYTLVVSIRSHDNVKMRHLTVCACGAGLTIMIALQLFFPLLPLYSAGYLFAICILHSFVVEGEKKDYRSTLDEMMQREKLQERELGMAKLMIYTDPLTGARSKRAYIEEEERIDKMIQSGADVKVGSVVFDLNNLKTVNDTLGHDTGDMYIRTACMLIGELFRHSPVFRIGGDEFTVVLEDQDYENRQALFTAFNMGVKENLRTNGVVIASGMADYDPKTDKNFRAVFERADAKMYVRKRELILIFN